MNKHISVAQYEKLMAKNEEFVDMLLREMNTKTWTPSAEGRRKAKEIITQTLTVLTKLHGLMEGTQRNAEVNADRIQKEMQKRDEKEAAAFAMAEAEKIAERIKAH